MVRRCSLAALVASLCIGSLGPVSSARAQDNPDVAFTFGIFGDLAYSAAEEPLMANVLADLDRQPLAFVTHVGDLGSPRAGSCTDELWARRLAQFQASANPLVYTLGDNDWTDCHDAQGAVGADPLERLPKLRSFFFSSDRSFGRRSIALARQSDEPVYAKYRENARWDLGGVTFFTLHVVGSNNGCGRTSAGDAECAERNSADLAWLHEGLAHARAENSRAVMIIQQANIFPMLPPFPGDPKQLPDGFAELRAGLIKEVMGFGKPVVLVHGDSHYFRIDKPFMRRKRSSGEPVLESFTRLETFGSPFHHWVEGRVDVNDPNVFAFRPRMVAANITPK